MENGVENRELLRRHDNVSPDRQDSLKRKVNRQCGLKDRWRQAKKTSKVEKGMPNQPHVSWEFDVTKWIESCPSI